MVLARATRIALDLLYPPRCVVCRRDGAMLCEACAGALPAADGPRCRRCWTAIERGDACRDCVSSSPRFASVRSAFIFEDGAQHLEYQLKFSGMHALAEPMAVLMASHIQRPAADAIVPVPLHPRRERARGYNQAAMLARHLGRVWNLPLDAAALRRIRPTAPLSRTMHRDERRAIVEGAFAARPERAVGRTIVLVDDVITTGATLDACAAALRDAGAAAVHGVTWARAD